MSLDLLIITSKAETTANRKPHLVMGRLCSGGQSFVVTSFCAYSAGARPTQGKLEGRKTMQTLQIKSNYFYCLGPVSQQLRKKGQTFLWKLRQKCATDFPS